MNCPHSSMQACAAISAMCFPDSGRMGLRVRP
jgi:hypothetical protein